ncbi:HK97 gp10 family phage protein [Desulfosporosinus lacus]|uniref:Bacteriophage HK97-gp10, putative tail-component n=1 Tax=Desulfosporosinus lacus DSM 15449 TaxID=1121420 RepID=A0A1M5QLR4_9FIRM|nr:HK97 gp10 family phage protein [Desulfosporosinus lacus]SHH14650.1 Bacteriophage HK97-gp10, putative tail-component [Desulfosporosinus lacus DSM 15449]
MSSFELNGLTEFERDLMRVINETFPNEAKKFMRKQVNDVKTQAKRDTPDDTGFTKAHWKTATKGKRRSSVRLVESTVTNNAPLSHLNEHGHRISNQYGEYGFYPGVHMLEKAVIKKESEFAREVSAFIATALEELDL